MKKLKSKFALLTILIIVTSCGVSNEEKDRVSEVTCSVIKESILLDASFRIEKINEAREKLKLPPYLDGDTEVKRSIEFGTCKSLVLNDETYYEKTNQLEAAFNQELNRLAKEKAEKEAEEARIRQERLAEEARIRQEKLMAEYEENKEQIELDAFGLCMGTALVNLQIGMQEMNGYVSQEQKDKAHMKPYLDKGIPEELASELSAATGLRITLDREKEAGTLSMKGACLDEVLPKECADIPKIGLEYKYFPERMNDYINIQVGANECSYLL
jgi:hypothetical protein